MVCGAIVSVRALLGIDFVMFRIVAATLGNVSPVKKKKKKKEEELERPQVGAVSPGFCSLF
jgi:hypothetical protein